MYLSEGGLTTADWLGVAATVVAVIGIVLSVYFYRRGKEAKYLQYALLEDQSLETNAPFPGLVIDVSYLPGTKSEQDESRAFGTGGMEVTRPRIWKLKVKNAGNRELTKGVDFQDPLLVVTRSGKLVDVYMTAVSREGIRPIGSVAADKPEVESVDITPRLMNSGDWMEMLVLTDGSDDTPELTTWLKGETKAMVEVSPEELEHSIPWVQRRLSRALIAVGAGSAIILTAVAVTGLLSWPWIITLGIIVYWLVIAGWYIRPGSRWIVLRMVNSLWNFQRRQ